MQKASFSIQNYLFDQVQINLESFQEENLKIGKGILKPI